MKRFLYTALLTILSAAAVQNSLYAQNQPEPPDMYELAAKEADRLQSLLKLEDWQLFMVDSTLQHNYVHMDQELKRLSEAKVSITSAYYFIQDKWMERTDSLYHTIFTESQWNSYMKSGAARQKKARDKRKSKLK